MAPKTKKKADITDTKSAESTWSTGNKMHTRLFLVLSYHDQLLVDADFESTGSRLLSTLPYWKSLSGHAMQTIAAKAHAGRTAAQMIKGYSLVPVAGTAKKDWENSYVAIEKLMVDATTKKVVDLGNAFQSNYKKDGQ